jgi:hypothetical protein
MRARAGEEEWGQKEEEAWGAEEWGSERQEGPSRGWLVHDERV